MGLLNDKTLTAYSAFPRMKCKWDVVGYKLKRYKYNNGVNAIFNRVTYFVSILTVIYCYR